MEALVLHAPRQMRREERERPEPGEGQVLVRVATGGICGSDLHYYFHGGFGQVRMQEPFIIGHELAGVVEEVGPRPCPARLLPSILPTLVAHVTIADRVMRAIATIWFYGQRHAPSPCRWRLS